MERAISFIGVFVLLGLAVAVSNNRKAIPWRVVFTGVAMQFGFAIIVLKTTPGQQFFQGIGHLADGLMQFAQEGIGFVFGNLANPSGPWNFVFAVKVLPTIIFFASLMNVLYYLGVMQWIVSLIAKVMVRFLGTSGAETLCAAANIFMGQTEAPLLIRPYIAGLTMSELLVVMVSGFATLAAGVLFIYAGMMSFFLPSAAGHLLAASVMSSIAAIVMTKIALPETVEPQTRGDVKVETPVTESNVIEAAANGASSGLSLALNVGAMLIAFIALVKMINGGLGFVGHELAIHAHMAWAEGLSLEVIFGVIFSPMAFIIGIPRADLAVVGDLMGRNLIINEFVAFSKLTEILNHGQAISGRSVALMMYVLCGFSNISSVGIQIGGIGAMAENRRGDLAKLGFKALFLATLANLQTAAIAGCLLSEEDMVLVIPPPISAPAPSSSATPPPPVATGSPSASASP